MNKFLAIALAAFGIGADVITVTSGSAGSAGSTAAELQTYFSAKLLEVAELNTILDQFGGKETMPSNSSLTVQFNREEKFTVSTSPTQLTQSVTPDAVGITINQLQAVIEQYGMVVRLSDLAELTAKHKIVERTIYLLGLHAAETYDCLIFNVLNAATNVYRPNSKAADTNLVATDVPAYKDLIQLDALLNDAGSRPFEDGSFVFVTPSQTYASLLNDADFKAARQFNKTEGIWKGEVDTLGGFKVVRSNAPGFAPTLQATSGQASKVYSSFAIGRFAYKVVDLQNLQVFVVAPGGQADPLQQNRKIGYKFAFKSIISNQSWIRLIRSAGANSVTNP